MASQRALICLLMTTIFLGFLVSRLRQPGLEAAEMARLRHANANLQKKLDTLEAQLAVGGRPAARGTTAAAAPSSAGDANASALADELLKLHSAWDWKAIAHDMLQPFSYIDEAMVENGVGECFKNGTMYCMRLQVVSNRLYITDYRAVFFDRHYAPARVMPMLDVLRRHKIPDVDLVVAAVDEPRVKTKVDLREWTATVQKYHGGASCVAGGGPAPSTSVASLPPPLFSSTVNRAHLDLAWPDFSFYMPRKPHKLRTPPWSSLHPQMLTQSARLSWDTKTPLAVHTGNVGSPFRKRLAEEARRSPGEMLVNELFIGDHGKSASPAPLAAEPSLLHSPSEGVTARIPSCQSARRAHSSVCTCAAASSSTSAT